MHTKHYSLCQALQIRITLLLPLVMRSEEELCQSDMLEPSIRLQSHRKGCHDDQRGIEGFAVPVMDPPVLAVESMVQQVGTSNRQSGGGGGGRALL